MEQSVTFTGSFMQSFTSIGPLLDIAALFSAIAVYSGPYLGTVMLISFLAAFTTVYVIWSLSKHFQSNGGYYLFAGKILGKSVGVSVSFLYVIYALLVVPNIALFVSFFILHFFALNSELSFILSYVVPLLFIFGVTGIVSQGLGKSIKYTIAAGATELIFILILDVLFLTHAVSFSFPILPTTNLETYSVFSGVVFGILAFAGMGSPVFLSEDTKKGVVTIPRALKYSYLVTGIVLVISAFSMMAFLGINGILTYSSNPFYVNDSIRVSFGVWAYAMFAVLAVLSSMNLSVAYSNSLLNAIRRMSKDGILPKKVQNNSSLILVFVVFEVVMITLANAFLGNFLGFVVIAAIVSFSFMAIHIIVGVSLIRLSIKLREGIKLLAASASVLILTVTIAFSFIADSSPGNPARISIIAFLTVVVISASVAYLGSTSSKSWYGKINIMNNLDSTESDR